MCNLLHWPMILSAGSINWYHADPGMLSNAHWPMRICWPPYQLVPCLPYHAHSAPPTPTMACQQWKNRWKKAPRCTT